MATEQEYIKFKSLLEYFVAHLEYVANKGNVSHCGYEKYIHPLVTSKTFKKTGTGYSGQKIQAQIADWEEYSVGKIAINCTPQYGGNYKTRLCYLNWIPTGLNVTPQWNDNHIVSLALESYQDENKWTPVVSPIPLNELGLYDDQSPNDCLKTFFDSFERMLTEVKQSEKWFPSDYTPGFSVEDWKNLINDPEIFNNNCLEIMARMSDFGGVATCKQLSDRYGESANFYNSGSSYLAKRIHEKTNCPVMDENTENSRWWPILYVGRYNEDKNVAGTYIWKLRPELAEALKQVDLSSVKLYAQQSQEGYAENVNFWWLNANPKMWSMSAAPIGEVQDYTLYNDKQHKRRIFQNFLDAQIGDMIIGYESTPVKQIVALFQIAKAQDGERIYFKKIEHLASPVDLTVLQAQPELAEMEFFKNSQASLLKLSAAEYDCILNLIRDVNPLPQVRKIEKYDLERFFSEVFMTSAKYESMVRILKAKKNIILQGAPGVGKTYAAKRLAYSIMTEMDDSRIEFVQFHQNYSYEDFVMGYKPNDNGFELKKGIFYSFCQKASSEPEKDYFFIIDEINRGNMSKIFGELLMLIEKDYRGTSLTLAYDGLPFRVPKNLHIIGMMNTADRSLAMIDYALRRRFSFFDMEPGFESDGFKAYLSGLNSEKLDKLVDEIKSLNNAIAEDKSLGKGFCIGHSYLCGAETYSKEWLQGVVEYDILPMLAEYWFDELDKYEEWKKRLTEIVK